MLKHKTQLYCEDIITNLRKAINYRVRDLVKNLGFNHIANPNLKKEQKLEQLEDIGIVKSLLIKKLLNIRNNIEYEGATPPNPSDCEELIDIVWYFYKTTDIYCKFKFGGLEFKYIIDEVMYGFIFDFDFDKHEYINFRGCVPDKFLSKTNTDNKKIPIDSLNERKSAKKMEHSPEKFYIGKISVNNVNNYDILIKKILSSWGE